ncbi:MAG: hypothetical protein NTX30_20905 [Deltaproteobacteria bacterium]|nr:hypothetical protein [Deltaproteobacteria bacterium]
MTQLLIEVPDPVAEKLRRRAGAQGLTVSQYLANLLCRELSEEWPPGFFEEVVGGWLGEPLERPPQWAYEHRERI